MALEPRTVSAAPPRGRQWNLAVGGGGLPETGGREARGLVFIVSNIGLQETEERETQSTVTMTSVPSAIK